MEKMKMPACKFDGTTDTDDHVAAYEGHMLLYTNNDSVWCKVFPSTLSGIKTILVQEFKGEFNQ